MQYFIKIVELGGSFDAGNVCGADVAGFVGGASELDRYPNETTRSS